MSEIGLNPFYYLTASSIAFNTFLAKYGGEWMLNTGQFIFQLPIEIDNEIRKSYFGGRTEAFIPHLEKGYQYDINSSYPAGMTKDLPVGRPAKMVFTKDIQWDLSYFGFFEVEVIHTPDLKIPFLSCKVPNKIGGYKLVFPKGCFKGIYFSEEINYAISLAYKIRPLGYVFERGNPLTSYVNEIYSRKANTKDPILRELYKTLLNTPYGRFG